MSCSIALDRDLGIAGRAVAADGTSTLVDVHEPIAQAQLAIHLDREVNERGLVLDRHIHVRPVRATGLAGGDDGDFVAWLGERAGVAPAFWELCLTTSSRRSSSAPTGRCSPAAASTTRSRAGRRPPPRLWAASQAHVAIAALFDHEEVGSESVSGASGPLLADVVERVLAGSGIDTVDDVRRAVASSTCIPGRQRPRRAPQLRGASRTRSRPAGQPRPGDQAQRQPALCHRRHDRCCSACCDKAGVPVQTFVSRNNILCGSTIGPLTATRLGIATVDVGVPQLSMHSARELGGAAGPWASRRRPRRLLELSGRRRALQDARLLLRRRTVAAAWRAARRCACGSASGRSGQIRSAAATRSVCRRSACTCADR